MFFCCSAQVNSIVKGKPGINKTCFRTDIPNCLGISLEAAAAASKHRMWAADSHCYIVHTTCYILAEATVAE